MWYVVIMDFLKQISKSEARRDFLQILNKIAQGLLKPILVTDHGKPQAVVLSYAEFQVMKIQAEMYQKSNKKAQESKSAWGGLELVDKNIDKTNIWDEIKDDWQAAWDKEMGGSQIDV